MRIVMKFLVLHTDLGSVLRCDWLGVCFIILSLTIFSSLLLFGIGGPPQECL